MRDLGWIVIAVLLAFALEWKLGEIWKEFKELVDQRDAQLEQKLDAAVDQLDRIAGILGGILADMPHLPSKGDPYLEAMKRRQE